MYTIQYTIHKTQYIQYVYNLQYTIYYLLLLHCSASRSSATFIDKYYHVISVKYYDQDYQYYDYCRYYRYYYKLLLYIIICYYMLLYVIIIIIIIMISARPTGRPRRWPPPPSRRGPSATGRASPRSGWRSSIAPTINDNIIIIIIIGIYFQYYYYYSSSSSSSSYYYYYYRATRIASPRSGWRSGIGGTKKTRVMQHLVLLLLLLSLLLLLQFFFFFFLLLIFGCGIQVSVSSMPTLPAILPSRGAALLQGLGGSVTVLTKHIT